MSCFPIVLRGHAVRQTRGMARSVGLAVLVLALTACGGSGSHAAASSPYTVEHVQQVFAAHQLRSTVPRTFAVGWTCSDLAGYRAFLDGGSSWHGVLFKDEQSAARVDRCMARRSGLDSAQVHLRRRNVVVVAKTNLSRRIRAALAAL